LHSPRGHGPPTPVQGPRRSPDPRFGGGGRCQGPRNAGSPSGRPSWDASAPRVRLTSPSGERRWTRDAGSWCVTDPHAPRHGDLSPLPGFGRKAGSDHPAPVQRPTSVDHRTFAGAFGRGPGSGLGRSRRPRTGRPGHRRREDLGPPRHDGPCVRSPCALSTSVDLATGDHGPPPGCTVPSRDAPLWPRPHWMPRNGNGKVGRRGGPRPPRVGGYPPTRPRILSGENRPP
jgi:hypothetical protein